MIAQDTAAIKRTEIIRAGAAYPSAVPSSYFQSPSQNPPPGVTGTALRKYSSPRRIVSTSERNARPQPAFGATRYEGAAGPTAALAPYANAAANHCRRRGQPAEYSKRSAGKAPPPESLEFTIAKGPTADTIISMTAAGAKPPVPEEEQIERQKQRLLEISVAMDAAVANDRNQTVHSISFDVTDKIPGYHQTWGVAFSSQLFTPPNYPPGPGEARYSQNYTPGTVQRSKFKAIYNV